MPSPWKPSPRLVGGAATATATATTAATATATATAAAAAAAAAATAGARPLRRGSSRSPSCAPLPRADASAPTPPHSTRGLLGCRRLPAGLRELVRAGCVVIPAVRTRRPRSVYAPRTRLSHACPAHRPQPPRHLARPELLRHRLGVVARAWRSGPPRERPPADVPG